MTEPIERTDLLLEGKRQYTDLTRRDIRSLVLHLLYAMHAHDYDISLQTVVDDVYQSFEFEIPVDSEACMFVKGVLEDRDKLDQEMEPYLKNWTIERLGVCTLLILRMALWELRNTETPITIVINEAIELAKYFSENDAYKFVNGILDQIVQTMKKEKQEALVG